MRSPSCPSGGACWVRRGHLVVAPFSQLRAGKVLEGQPHSTTQLEGNAAAVYSRLCGVYLSFLCTPSSSICRFLSVCPVLAASHWLQLSLPFLTRAAAAGASKVGESKRATKRLGGKKHETTCSSAIKANRRLDIYTPAILPHHAKLLLLCLATSKFDEARSPTLPSCSLAAPVILLQPATWAAERSRPASSTCSCSCL